MMDALCEITKLVCNIAALYPLQSSEFSTSCRPILQILSAVEIPSPPLQPPVSSLINCLVFIVPDLSIDYEEAHITHLVRILDQATQAYPADQLDRSCSPLAQLLLLISQSAPARIKALLQTLLLPTATDRERVLGTDDSLPSRLLRISTSLTAGQLRVLIPRLLFELSNKDEERFVRNIGYGYASGFLYSMGNTNSAADGSTAQRRTEGRSDQRSIGDGNAVTTAGDVNPLTGQRRDHEIQPDLPEMTEEEKEREAERLFVLFERCVSQVS